jgi:ubiquinone/menaquinone biosynthesis C-methylase UbiE
MNNIEQNNWLKIWSKTPKKNETKDVLSFLIKTNGFDSPFGFYSSNDWINMTNDLIKKLNIGSETNVFEIGCGSGALLYSLNLISNCKVDGLDFSPSLVKLARKYLPSSEIYQSEALTFVEKFDSYDVVLSHSVFQYFPNHKYAYDVMTNSYMMLKKGGFFCVMDINDASTYDLYHSERAAFYKNPDEYFEKYKNLEHLFFDKTILKNELKKAGFKNITFFRNLSRYYINSKYRFNFIAQK